MNNDVSGINQRPITLIRAFQPGNNPAFALQFLDELIDNRADVARRPTTCDDHVIGNGRFSAKIDCHNINRLIVVERRRCDFEKTVGMLPTCFVVKSPAPDCTGIKT